MREKINKVKYIVLCILFVFPHSTLLISAEEIPIIKLSELKQEQHLEYTFSFPITENLYPGANLPKRSIRIVNDTKDDVQIKLITEYSKAIFSSVKINTEEKAILEKATISSNSSIVINMESSINEDINNDVQGKKEYIQITLNVNVLSACGNNSLLPKTNEYINYMKIISVGGFLIIISYFIGKKKNKRRRYM